jgi:hypothetical protein
MWFRDTPVHDFSDLYHRFQAPIAALDCGELCAPHNERGVPFCCDLHHAIPTAYLREWDYLQSNTDLWHAWQGHSARETERIRSQVPEGQVPVACKGHLLCQRSFRAITCRAFPFFPYLTRQGIFIGLGYYWEYEDRCWVISHLDAVSREYRAEFCAAFEALFKSMPEERENFWRFSKIMRQVFGRRHRAIPILHRNGLAYKITPRNGRMRRIETEKLPVFGPYHIADQLPFPDEMGKESV